MSGLPSHVRRAAMLMEVHVTSSSKDLTKGLKAKSSDIDALEAARGVDNYAD